MTRVLFVCSQNLLRSPTAEHVFADVPGVETMSAGINPTAVTPVSDALLGWADVVVGMEPVHRLWLTESFPEALGDTPVHVLDIPDRFSYMDTELVELLKSRVAEHVPALGASAG